jgi:hypothetical protein
MKVQESRPQCVVLQSARIRRSTHAKGPRRKPIKGATVHKESGHFYPEAQLMKEGEVEVEDEDGSEGEEGKPL